MSPTEQSRHQLFEELDRILGPEKAATLMELLPPVGWADVATKRDLDRLGEALRGELATVEANLRGKITAVETNLRGELTAMGTKLNGKIDTVDANLRGAIAAMGVTLDGKIDTVDASHRAEIQQTRAEFHRDHHNQTIAIIGANATITGLLLAAFRFL